LLVAISVSFYSKFGIYGEVLKDKKEEVEDKATTDRTLFVKSGRYNS
jgi:hypothetical protein